jgi:23S rRNA (adenine2503-C2)-methyltransferase
MEIKNFKNFANGTVYCLKLNDNFLIETTDTFLPFYTKHAINRKQNLLDNNKLGDRTERWMIGVSVMSGCPVHCKFCATGQLKKYRNLTSEEIIEQVEFVINKHPEIDPNKSKEFKINYTRMGDFGLNLENVKQAIFYLNSKYTNIHHYVSTIGIKDVDYSWIKDNITLQLSLHSLDENRRNDLIPFKQKLTIEELGKIRTNSNLKTTLNLTLVDEKDFDMSKILKYFDKNYFFIKLSPINTNVISKSNNLGDGVITGVNLI